MRTGIFVVLLMLMPVAGQAQGDLGTAALNSALNAHNVGTELLGHCESESSASQGICLGYLAAVSDSIYYNKMMLPKPNNSSGFFDHSDTCPPVGRKVGQVEKVWIKWANDHPEHLHMAAYNLVLAAFIDAWPCN